MEMKVNNPTKYKFFNETHMKDLEPKLNEFATEHNVIATQIFRGQEPGGSESWFAMVYYKK